MNRRLHKCMACGDDSNGDLCVVCYKKQRKKVSVEDRDPMSAYTDIQRIESAKAKARKLFGVRQ